MAKNYEKELDDFFQIEELWEFKVVGLEHIGTIDEIYDYVDELIDSGKLHIDELSGTSSVIKDNFEDMRESFIERNIERVYSLEDLGIVWDEK